MDDENPAEVIAAVKDRIRWVSARLGLSGIRPFVYYAWSTSGAEQREAVMDVYRDAVGPSKEADMKTIAQDLIDEGRVEGRVEGREETRARLAHAILNQFEVQFGHLTQEQRERIQSASVDELEKWLPLVVQAESVEDVIGDS